MFCFAWNHMAQRATPNKSHLVCPLSLGELMVFLSFINAENVYFPMFLMFLTVFRCQSSGLPTSAMLYHLCNALQPDAAASWWKWVETIQHCTSICPTLHFDYVHPFIEPPTRNHSTGSPYFPATHATSSHHASLPSLPTRLKLHRVSSQDLWLVDQVDTPFCSH